MTWKHTWLCGVIGVVLGGCHTSSPAEGPADAVGAEPPPAVAVPLQSALPDTATGSLVFHSDREGRHRLFTIEIASGNVTRLTTGRDYHDEDAAWSPDGRYVAFTTTRFDARTWDIAVMAATGETVRRVTSHLAFDRHAAWMPDGQSVLFSSEQDGTQAVFRASLDTGQVTRVSPPPERALLPSASPDGRRVAYTMGTPDGLRVVVQNLATGELQMVTPAGVDAAAAIWSPDGKRLAYVRLSGEGSSIEILTLATGNVLPLAVGDLAAVREPAWSPDGLWLAAAGSRTVGAREDWDLVLLSTGPRPAAYRLSAGPANDRAPAWIPR